MLAKNLYSFQIEEKPPAKLNSLVCFDPQIKSSTKTKTYEILSYIWSDYEGKVLLNNLIKDNIKIYILSNKFIPHAEIKHSSDPWDNYAKIKVRIEENSVQEFKNKSMSEFCTQDSIRVFIHEICHAVAGYNPEYKMYANSIEEELCIDMICKNILFRLMGEKGLSEDDAKIASRIILLNLLTDSHKDLCLHNQFNIEMTDVLGINIPYYDDYSDILKVYQDIRYLKSVNRNNSIEKEMSDNNSNY